MAWVQGGCQPQCLWLAYLKDHQSGQRLDRRKVSPGLAVNPK